MRLSWGKPGGDRSGYAVSTAGDVNGDGFDDFMIGALYGGHFSQELKPEIGGQTYLFLGRAQANWGQQFSLAGADASFHAEGRFDLAGHSVAGVGDVNGDGFDDFAIGASDNSDGRIANGQTYLMFGEAEAAWGTGFSLSSADASFAGKAAFDASGFAVSAAGDVNGDGFDDFLIGAPNSGFSENFAGETYLVLGTSAAIWGRDSDLAEAAVSYTGEAVYDLSGSSVASAGDINGDGFDDILIGAWQNNDGGADAGKTYLVLGSSDLATSVTNGAQPQAFLLSQNYPNPFNPTTIISYELPVNSHVELKIYNQLGQEIRTLANSMQPAGTHQVVWNGRDNSGTIVPSGLYFYQLQAGAVVETRKMVLMR